MRLGGRVSAAIEVLADMTTRKRPAADALQDWGKSHRFAGSSDRHAIGTLVYDALRRRNSAAALMGDDRARAQVLGALALVWGKSALEIEAICSEKFGPGELSADEKKSLSRSLASTLAPHIAGDFPEWLQPELQRAFGNRLVPEMAALARRAPIDLRVNTVKATRDDVAQRLAKFAPAPTPLSPVGLRIAPPSGEGKHINVEAEPAHGLGLFEIQDEASQLAAVLSGAQPGEKILDLCAGAGGKSLALAAQMKNSGKIIAYDRDKHRLRPIFERITRSGVGNIDVVAADDMGALAKDGGFDLVVVDAPCTGSGTWRRKPDAKWRLTQKQLDVRLREQREVMDQAATLVKRCGRLAYFTCSVLPSENIDQVAAFLSRHTSLAIIPFAKSWQANLASPVPASADGRSDTLQLTPESHGTDGFFISLFQRA